MSVRCFIGIELSEPMRQTLSSAREAIIAADPRWRTEKWVTAQNLHVTLKFLGNLDDGDIDALIEACGREVASVAPFRLAGMDLKAVPARRRARMIWATLLDPDGESVELAAATERAALAVGVPPDDRTFKPHVTLARARSPHAIDSEALTDARAVLASAREAMSVTAVTVFQSVLGQHEPVYTVLATCPLGSA